MFSLVLIYCIVGLISGRIQQHSIPSGLIENKNERDLFCLLTLWWWSENMPGKQFRTDEGRIYYGDDGAKIPPSLGSWT
jgi:hypothetical protein